MLTDNQKQIVDQWAKDLIAGVLRDAAEAVAAKLDLPVAPIQELADAGVFNRTLSMEGGEVVADDTIIPLLFANMEIVGMQLAGRLTEDEAKDMLHTVDNAIEANWPIQAKCDGPWQVTMPDGRAITLTFMQQAWKKR
jgi:hypothetical protein